MYTNQTAEELELERCTTDGIYGALTSPIMKINVIFSIIIIILTFWYSYHALKLLIYHNIFSNCTRILLMFNLLNGNIWQAVYLVVRARNMYKMIRYADNRCMIEFHSSECIYEQTITHYCLILSTFLVFALTCDRIIASSLSKQYYCHQKLISRSMIGISLFLTLLIHLWTFLGIPLAGYVPTCYYPPQLSLDHFSLVNNATFYFNLFNCLLTIVILIVNLKIDRKIRQSSFNTTDRYSSFENLETTKALCSISSTQFFFLSFGSVAIRIIRSFEAGMSEKTYHLGVSFLVAILYSNLSIPILICYQTNKCINKRKERIGSMTSTHENMDNHISNLQKMWS